MEKETFVKIFEGTGVKAADIWEAQRIAMGCFDRLPEFLKEGRTREEIHDFAGQVMTDAGADAWWTHDDPALVLFGDLTPYSGRQDPAPLFAGRTVQADDMITVDVGPSVRGGWGDATRAFFLRGGKLVDWRDCGIPEIVEGMELEMELHARLLDFVKEDTTYADLHAFTEGILRERGWHNCDYHGNFGHSIENHPDDRVTIIPEETRSIAAYGKPITYEPHICKDGCSWGCKHENMYVFHEGRLQLV